MIVVDDGFATGVTAQAALEAVRRERPARVVLAVPVAPADVAKIVGAAAERSSPCSLPRPSGRSASSTTASTRPPTPRSSPPTRPRPRFAVLKSQMHRNGASGSGERSSTPPGVGRRPSRRTMALHFDAGWSSPVARRAHNPKVAGSNPAPATNVRPAQRPLIRVNREGPPGTFRRGSGMRTKRVCWPGS